MNVDQIPYRTIWTADDGWRVRISVELPFGIGHVITYEGTVVRPAQHSDDGDGATVGGSGKGWW